MEHKRRPDLAQRLVCSSPSWAFVFCKSNIFLLAGLRVLDLDLNWHNLILKPARLLCNLSAPIALGRKPVLLLPTNVEVVAYILARLAHGLHAVAGVLSSSKDFIEEGTFEAITT